MIAIALHLAEVFLNLFIFLTVVELTPVARVPPYWQLILPWHKRKFFLFGQEVLGLG